MGHDYDIPYHALAEHFNADALSRRPDVVFDSKEEVSVITSSSPSDRQRGGCQRVHGHMEARMEGQQERYPVHTCPAASAKLRAL